MYQSELILVSLISYLLQNMDVSSTKKSIQSQTHENSSWNPLDSVKISPINIPKKITMFKIPLSPHKIPLISIHFQVPQIVFRPGASAEHLGRGHGDGAWEFSSENCGRILGGVNRMLSMGLLCVYIYICKYIWVNYNDLTATSLESWLIRGITSKWP